MHKKETKTIFINKLNKKIMNKRKDKKKLLVKRKEKKNAKEYIKNK